MKEIPRRRLLFLLLIPFLMLAGCATAPQKSDRVELFEKEPGKNTILLAAKADDQEIKAAEELTHYLKKISGEKWEIVRENQSIDNASISVGRTKLFEKSGLNLSKLGDEGIVMATRNGTLFLVGKTPIATLFAAYRFLYKYGGVRWYLPTELGEHVPRVKEWKLKWPDDVEEPTFIARKWSEVAPFDGGTWERRNLTRTRDRHGHNLHNLFEDKLFEKHPEWFPLFDGKRYPPLFVNWQPVFNNPEVAAHAAGKAMEAFEQEPERENFSLCINDSYRYDQGPESKNVEQLEAEGKIFRYRPDYSDDVFTFTNRAAKKVAEKFPNKFVIQYAYGWCENAPSFDLEPNVIVYLTADRAHWWDPDFRKEDQDLIRRWLEKAKWVGLYDYFYGAGYVIPRQFNHLMAKVIQFARKTGVSRFYGEIYSCWSLDGPKAWLGSQLLWNPEQDVDELLDDFYANFFQEAERPMRDYFNLCEKQWETQGGSAYWIKYLFDPVQLELFPSEICAKARQHLERAKELAKSELIQKRVQLFSEGFRTTELWSELYFRCKELSARKTESVEDYQNLISGLKELVETQNRLDAHYQDVILPNDLHRPPIAFERRLKFHPTTRLVSRVEEWLKETEELEMGDEMREELKKVAETFHKSRLKGALTFYGRKTEEIEIQDAPRKKVSYQGLLRRVWRYLFSEMARLTDQKEKILRISGVHKKVFYHLLDIEPGKMIEFSVNARGRVSSGNRTQLTINWMDGEGELLRAFSPMYDQLLEGETKEWTRLSVIVPIPPKAREAVVLVGVQNQAPGDYTEFDWPKIRCTLPPEKKTP